MAGPTIGDAIAAIARNTRFTDEGDRQTVLAFCDREDNPEDTDPFAPRLSNGDDESEGGETGDEFDPSAHTVAEVNEHLADASDEERDRVLNAERAGKNRASIAGV